MLIEEEVDPPAADRAPVGSTEASGGRLARFGRIDEWH
jgi:hypothetical protein